MGSVLQTELQNGALCKALDPIQQLARLIERSVHCRYRAAADSSSVCDHTGRRNAAFVHVLQNGERVVRDVAHVRPDCLLCSQQAIVNTRKEENN